MFHDCPYPLYQARLVAHADANAHGLQSQDQFTDDMPIKLVLIGPIGMNCALRSVKGIEEIRIAFNFAWLNRGKPLGFAELVQKVRRERKGIAIIEPFSVHGIDDGALQPLR